MIVVFLSLLLLSAADATVVGVNYDPTTPNLPHPERIVQTLISKHITAVRLLHPTPAAVRAFANSDISVILTVPNHHLPSFAANLSSATHFLADTVLPFHPRTRITLISAGNDPLTAADEDNNNDASSAYGDTSTTLLYAVRNLRAALHDLGLQSIPVSTTFSFVSIMTTSFPPSAAEFQEPMATLVLRPLLQFLSETNSSFLINLHPYDVYRINAQIPVGYALFQENPFNFRDDVVTGVRYRNLFDMMVDAVVAAMAVSGHENIPLVVAETGWPDDDGDYAGIYLKGLVRHLRSGEGTPLRREGPAEAYLYQLFDDGNDELGGTNTDANGTTLRGVAGKNWGIMYPNMTMKYKGFDISGSIVICKSFTKVMVTLVLGLVISFVFTFAQS